MPHQNPLGNTVSVAVSKVRLVPVNARAVPVLDETLQLGNTAAGRARALVFNNECRNLRRVRCNRLFLRPRSWPDEDDKCPRAQGFPTHSSEHLLSEGQELQPSGYSGFKLSYIFHSLSAVAR